MVLAEGIAVSGEYVEKLKNKKFVVIKAPHYETFKDQKTDKDEKRAVMTIELSDHVQLDYYPNKTSMKMMVKLEGFEMDKWVGKAFEFEVIPQKAFGENKKVLYVLDVVLQ